jgi:hypothetical protein
MTKEELKQIVREEILNVLKEEFGQGYGVSTSPEEEAVCPTCSKNPCECGMEEMDERTVARREPPRKMSKPQIKGRDGIGKKMLKSKRAQSYFRKKFGDDWKSYMWAAATNKAIDKHD